MWLYPYSKAKYIRPGSLSLLSKTKIGVPPLPEYQQIFREHVMEPTELSFKQLFEKVR